MPFSVRRRRRNRKTEMVWVKKPPRRIGNGVSQDVNDAFCGSNFICKFLPRLLLNYRKIPPTSQPASHPVVRMQRTIILKRRPRQSPPFPSFLRRRRPIVQIIPQDVLLHRPPSLSPSLPSGVHVFTNNVSYRSLYWLHLRRLIFARKPISFSELSVSGQIQIKVRAYCTCAKLHRQNL